MATRQLNAKGADQTQSANKKDGHCTFPSLNGNAYHTLTGAQLAEMTECLLDQQPSTTSAALSLLRRFFPESPVELQLKACAAYTEKLKSSL